MEQKTPKGLIALLFVGVLMGALDISIVGPAIPSMESNLHIGPRFSGWIFSIYVLFNLVGISLFARLSDIFGRRYIYIIALTVFALGSLWVSLSTNFEYLLIGRAIQGFGASGIFPVASAVVGDIFPPEKRGRILGLIGAVFGIAFLIGPFVAGVLLHYLAWNFLFIINLPVSAVLIYFSFKILPSVPNIRVSRIDWSGIVTLGISLASLTFGLNNLNSSGLDTELFNSTVIFSLSLSVLSLIIFFLVEKRAENPIIKFSFFSNRQILIAGVIAVVTGVVQACFVFIPKFVVQSFSVAPSTASFMLTPFVIAVAIGSPLFGRLIDKFGVKKIIIIGLACLIAGFYILSLSSNQITLYYTSGIFIGLGLSVLAGSSLRYIMLNNTSVDDRAVSQGMLTIFISVGQLVGTAIIGLVLASLIQVNAYQNIFTGVAVLLFFMLVLAFRLKNTAST
jgi:EmrB/QacA subfamily drug resistance transporter